ncbi:MAG: serine O-acetyltransferase [Pseudohongiellaceae bacterium]
MPEKIWLKIKAEISEQIIHEPVLASFLSKRVNQHDSFESALSDLLASKLSSDDLPVSTLKNFIYEAFLEDSSIIDSAINDLIAFKQRDPAVKAYSDIMLYFKGFQAIQAYRVANWLWKHQRENLAFYLQSLISQVFTLDIHPAAEIGSGIMLDHATGIVIGETAVLQDNISIMQGVTLGGTGNERGDRHPKINSGVLIGSNAQVIGNITVGEGAKIGSGSVVLDDIEPHTTVAGIPAVVIGKPKVDQPALDMDHILNSTE